MALLMSTIINRVRGEDFPPAREGFGWMNASFQVGLKRLSPNLRPNLERLEPLLDPGFEVADRVATDAQLDEVQGHLTFLADDAGAVEFPTQICGG